MFTFSSSKVAHLANAGCKTFLYFAATATFDTCDYYPNRPSTIYSMFAKFLRENADLFHGINTSGT